MGYSANGNGSATLKKGVNKSELREILDKVIEGFCDGMEYDFGITRINGEDEAYISFWEYDDHWHEADTMEFLKALTPYATEGSAEYSGEDNCQWRYRLDNEGWLDEGGTIYYSDEDMIKYLEGKGYKVIKAA